MKKMKKIIALVLSMIMVVAMSVTAFADPGADSSKPVIRVAEDDTHEYGIYQIFTADLSVDATTNKDVLSNVKWGADCASGYVTGEQVPQDILDELMVLAESTDNEAKLQAIEKYVDWTKTPTSTVKKDSPVSVAAGYYLLKDITQLENADDTNSINIVKIVKNLTIESKKDKPESWKKVDDVNDSDTSENAVVWQDSADYDVGDLVPFQLNAKLPEDFASYKKYQLTFHDVEEQGLTFKKDTLKVYAVNGDDKAEIPKATYNLNTKVDDSCTFEVHFADLKTIEGVTINKDTLIVVEYESELNENAIIGADGNKNTMHITYSNNPNDEKGGEKGKTPNDTVIVFTFKTVVDKVVKNPDFDESQGASESNPEFLPLEGAGFTLYKKVPVMVTDTDGNLVQEKDSEDNLKYSWEQIGNELKGTEAVPMTTFSFERLDAGVYKLSETTVPAGYNKIDDIEFTITAEHDVESQTPGLQKFNGVAKDGTITIVASKADGSVSTNIENKKGATLPETGGIGTTIFYVVGAILMIGAGVMLVTRKRISR